MEIQGVLKMEFKFGSSSSARFALNVWRYCYSRFGCEMETTTPSFRTKMYIFGIHLYPELVWLNLSMQCCKLFRCVWVMFRGDSHEELTWLSSFRIPTILPSRTEQYNMFSDKTTFSKKKITQKLPPRKSKCCHNIKERNRKKTQLIITTRRFQCFTLSWLGCRKCSILAPGRRRIR